jgi:hypothetical protein
VDSIQAQNHIHVDKYHNWKYERDTGRMGGWFMEIVNRLTPNFGISGMVIHNPGLRESGRDCFFVLLHNTKVDVLWSMRREIVPQFLYIKEQTRQEVVKLYLQMIMD